MRQLRHIVIQQEVICSSRVTMSNALFHLSLSWRRQGISSHASSVLNEWNTPNIYPGQCHFTGGGHVGFKTESSHLKRA